jgi:hypothetical protein
MMVRCHKSRIIASPSLRCFEKKRNIGGYAPAGSISEQEADEMATQARDLRHQVQNWLEKHHPELLEKVDRTGREESG